MLATKEIAEILGVKTNTIRKYAAALEAQGYSVERDANGNREYTQLDATVFRELQALQQRTGLTVEKCSEVVAARHRGAPVSVAPVVNDGNNQQIMQHDERYTELMQIINRQSDELSRVHDRLDQQNANISIILREVLETRRMVAAAGVKRWWQFWKKELPEFQEGPDPEAVWKRKEDIKNGNY